MESSYLINNLSLHQRYWSIKVLVTEKDKIKDFKSSQGKFQKVTLMDMEGSKIYAIMFNDIIEKFGNILEINKIYIVSNGQVKDINKTFYNVNEKFEIILNNLTEIHEEVAENKFHFVHKLSTVADIKANPNLPSDIILLVKKVNEIQMIYRRRDKQKIVKRELQVYGLRSELLILTLWELLATVQGQQLEEVKDDYPVILAKSVVGKYFNGFTLSTTSSTILEINPNIPESKEIKDWFANIEDNDITPSNEGFILSDLLKINTAEHSSGEIKYYDTKVTIRGIKEEGSIWYNACNICKSKVIISGDLVECTKCSKKTVEYSLRYLVKLDVEDSTTTSTFTLFDDEAQNIIGLPVIELQKLKTSNIEEYRNVLTRLIGSVQIFTIKAQDKFYGNRSQRTLVVQTIKNFDRITHRMSKKIKLEND